jgi:GNAT superfamily N-acetyltransferase
MAKKKAAADRRVELPLTTEILTPDGFQTVERLFGEKGACGGCWCMWPRVPKGGKEWQQAQGAKNKERFQHLVQAGDVHAVFAFAGDEPVGWCSFGPRKTFPRLETVKALKREWSPGTWSIVCFYIPSKWRGRGVASRLLRVATETAFSLGAQEIEGYPVVSKTLGSTLPAAFAWTGVEPLFKKSGYKKLHRPGTSRPIYLKVMA